MRLKSVIKTDFVPMVKKPRMWISAETLRVGSVLDVEPEIGHQLLASYPGAFQVVSYEEPTRKRTKQVKSEDLVEGTAAEFGIVE
jgi:hypothetical protein